MPQLDRILRELDGADLSGTLQSASRLEVPRFESGAAALLLAGPNFSQRSYANATFVHQRLANSPVRDSPGLARDDVAVAAKPHRRPQYLASHLL